MTSRSSEDIPYHSALCHHHHEHLGTILPSSLRSRCYQLMHCHSGLCHNHPEHLGNVTPNTLTARTYTRIRSQSRGARADCEGRSAGVRKAVANDTLGASDICTRLLHSCTLAVLGNKLDSNFLTTYVYTIPHNHSALRRCRGGQRRWNIADRSGDRGRNGTRTRFAHGSGFREARGWERGRRTVLRTEPGIADVGGIRVHGRGR